MRRDVLSGTPAPQGAFDLIAPMRFLYPGQDRQILPPSAYRERDGRETDVLDATSRAVSRYFVRTPKSRLELPPTTPDVVRLPMKRVQQSIYQALLGRYRGKFELAGDDRRRFDRLGRIMMYLLEAATNPMLLTAGSDREDEASFAHPPLEIDGDEPLWRMLEGYRDFEVPWKYDKVREIVAQAAATGEKVIVWSTFVRNLRALATHLGDFHPAVVHGGVPPADGAPPGALTRDEELDRFRHDRTCSVLLANPAACGEGVSLHHWCHHAVYLDRTFNAGHFLQSQDRIHRLGLEDGTITRFTYLLSKDSIDDAVDNRLRDKVNALATLMNDPDLVRIALPEPDEHRDGSPIFDDDADAVVAHLRTA
jgi:SNF2 family DNA or RNA helicase